MKIRAPYRLPADKQRDLEKLKKLEWLNLFSRLTIIFVMYLALGNSQAMKASWYEDILSLLPTIMFLVAVRFRDKEPNETFPYGYQRITIIAFLGSSVALLLMGGFLFIDSGLKLISMRHPTIGTIELFGTSIWMGWTMLAALAYGMTIPFILSFFQQRLSARIHEKTVFADAKMSKADWMTGLAASIGILGAGMGLWWMDALAGALISLDIMHDGYRNLREATGDTLDRHPRFTAKVQPSKLHETLEKRLLAMPWVEKAEVRLREEGHAFSGEAFVVPRSDENLSRNITNATRDLVKEDWRLYEIVITPVSD